MSIEAIIPAIEREFEVNDLCLRGLQWQTPEDCLGSGLPLLCLHGWLDNAASFIRLAPELARLGHECVALDFAGNGQSSHRTLHGYYNIWDDLIDIEAVINALGWQEYAIVGHSRGGGVSALYASTKPDNLHSLVLLDGMLWAPEVEDTIPEQLKDFLSSRKKALAKATRRSASSGIERSDNGESVDKRFCLASLHEAWEKRHKHCQLDYEDMLPLLERATIHCGTDNLGNECLQWSHDQRYLSRSVYRLTEADCQDVARSISVPTLLLQAEENDFFETNRERILGWLKHAENFELQQHAGNHHFHLQKAHATSIGQYIARWFRET